MRQHTEHASIWAVGCNATEHATEHGCRRITVVSTQCLFSLAPLLQSMAVVLYLSLRLTLGSSCERVLESMKATGSVVREKTYIRGTRAVLQLVCLLHVGALVSALPLSAPRKNSV